MIIPRWLYNAFAFVALVWTCGLGPAQTTTVTIPTTTHIANIPRLGINLGGGQTALSYFGPNQLFKNLNYAQGGDMPGFYWATTYECNSGPNSVFNWSNDIADTQGYPTDFWAGATFTTATKDTGASIGSGTVSHSSANTTYPGAGVLLEGLTPQLTRTCNATAEPPPTFIPYGDILTARLLTPGSVALALMTPNNFYGGFPASSTWNTDTSPASTNTIHSLELLTGTVASFADDAVLQNATNPNGTLAATYVPWINVNGTGYTQSVKAKCLTAGCSLGVYVGRPGGTTFLTATLSPTFNTTPGAGWQTFTNTFNASETGAQTSGIYYVLSCTGTCLIQDADLIEPSTLAGNTTPFRDAVVSELQKMHPGSLRYMDSSQWCSDVADEIAPTGNRRWCGASQYVSYVQGSPIGYDDFLQLANVVGADAWISVGITNQPADWTTLINWLNTSGWISTFAASGHKIYLEDGNEPWNTGAVATMVDGEGIAYGGVLGPNMAAAKAASGYNSSVVKLVGDSWTAPFQGYSSFGWLANTMQAAGCTTGTRTNCPDFVTNAPYTLSYLNNFDTTGANVSPTGAPFLDEWAEISNIDSVSAPPSDWLYASGSINVNTAYGISTYNIPMATYESNISLTNGNTVTQTQLNQIASSVGEGLAQGEHMLLQQRDAGVSGPINFFNLAQYYFNYNDTHPPAVGMWGCMIALGTGPGQAVNSANYERPDCTVMDIINQAIGSNNNLIASTQSGTPTFSYPGGQPMAGFAGTKNTILANASVPYVNAFAYANNAKTSWTVLAFNNNLTTSETVVLSGAGAPTGAVTKVLFPNSGNVITDHNEATYVGPSSLPLVVTYPAATATSGTSYTIPAASMIALTYNTSGTPTASTPAFSPAPTVYFSTQSVTVTSSGSLICYNTTGASIVIGGGSSCPGGSTTYTGPITVASTETITAVAGGTGWADSSVGTGAYTITTPPQAATPAFAPGGGLYSAPQTVTITSSTSGVTNCVTTDGTTPTAPTPGTCSNGSPIANGGTISVATSETVKALATIASGFTNSAVTSASYTITPLASTPTFSPVAGPYPSTQMVVITSSTSSVTLCYTQDGTTPTATTGTCTHGSTLANGGTVSVSTTQTVNAIATIASGFQNSNVGSAAYTITGTPTAATPTFSPSTSSGIVGSIYPTISTATSGCGAYINYNFTGNQSGGNLTGTTVGINFYFASAGTVSAQVIGCPGYANSAIATATYAFAVSNWYVRPDGGTHYTANNTSGQCDGHHNAAWVSGTNQPCALNEFSYGYDDGSGVNFNWISAQGDTWIINGCVSSSFNGSTNNCRVGWTNATNATPVRCVGLSAGGCHPPPPPNNTTFEGSNFGSCTNQRYGVSGNEAQIFGGFDVSTIFDLSGSQGTVFACIEMTTHNATGCVTHGSPAMPSACSTSSPYSDFASVAITTNNQTTFTYTDGWIHGFADRGIKGPIGGTESENRVAIQMNGMAGRDFDDGSSTPSANNPTWNYFNGDISWNGCNQEAWPTTHTIPVGYCYSQSSGGYGDGVGTPSGTALNVDLEGSNVTYNTQDGVDLGHVTGASTIVEYGNTFYGNMGAPTKWGQGYSGRLQNLLLVANGYRMSAAITGAPSTFNTYLSDFDRSNDAVSWQMGATQSLALSNITLVTYFPNTFDIGCGLSSCTGSAYTMQNMAVLAYDNPNTYGSGGQAGGPAGYYCQNSSFTQVACNATGQPVMSRSNNLYYGLRTSNFSCPTGFTAEQCANPLLTNQPTGNAGTFTESELDSFLTLTNFTPTSTSPTAGAGILNSFTPSLDYFKTATTSPNPVEGGVNAAPPAPPTAGITKSGNIVSSGNVVGP
jgi:hypothetical protein